MWYDNLDAYNREYYINSFSTSIAFEIKEYSFAYKKLFCSGHCLVHLGQGCLLIIGNKLKYCYKIVDANHKVLFKAKQEQQVVDYVMQNCLI